MAGGKVLKVTIAGDAAQLRKALAEAEGDTVSFQGSMGKAAKGAEDFASRSEKAFGRIREAAKGLAEIAGVSALAFGLKDVTEEAVKAQAEQLKLANTVKDAGLSWGAHSKAVEEWLDKTSRASGFAKSELTASLGNLIRTTGSVTKAQQLNSQAMDIARSKGTSLATAQGLLTRVYNGSFTGLKRLGIAVTPVTTAQDALAASTTKATAQQKEHAKQLDAVATRTQALGLVTEKFGGQSDAYAKSTAGAFARAKASLQLVEERVGAVVLPLMAQAAGAIANLADSAQRNWPQISATADKVFGPLKATFGTIVDSVGDVIKGFRDGKTWAVALVAAIAGFTAAAVTIKTITLAVAAWTKATELMTAAQIALDGAMDANPITIVAAAVAALGAALVVAYEKSATFRSIVNGVFAAVKTVAVTAINAILGALTTLLGVWQGMLSALGHIPGFGWAKTAAGDIQNARDEVDRFRASLRQVKSPAPVKISLDVSDAARARQQIIQQLSGIDLSTVKALPKTKPGHATGGIIGGQGRGDIVPALLEPGEFVIQRKVVEKFGPTFFNRLNAIGPKGFKAGGLVDAGELEGLAQGAGFTATQAKIMAAIALAESGGNPGATHRNSNGTTDRGLWQINSVHAFKGNPMNPAENAREARAVFKQQGYGAWTTYKSGAYKQFLDDVANAGKQGVKSGVAMFGKPNAIKTTAGTTFQAPSTGSFDQKMADSDVAINKAALTPSNADDIDALQAQRMDVKTRLNKVTAALKGHLTAKTRLRLTQERGQLLGQLGQIDNSVKQLQTPDTSTDTGTVDDGKDPNQALIDSNQALIDSNKQRAEADAALQASIDANTQFAQSVVATENASLTRSLADLISGQIAGFGIAGRSLTPGSGTVARYAYSAI